MQSISLQQFIITSQYDLQVTQRGRSCITCLLQHARIAWMWLQF